MLRDRIQPGVTVLFVGINPGMRSEAIGHHFAGYSNRFWKLLHESRLVPEPVGAEDDVRLPEWGFGLTNLVPRATPGIDTLRPGEFAAGARALRRKIGRFKSASSIKVMSVQSPKLRSKTGSSTMAAVVAATALMTPQSESFMATSNGELEVISSTARIVTA